MSIEAVNITLGYDDKNIIENLSCSIPEGKVTILIGANGCGKSTLLKGMCRLNSIKSGEIKLYKKNISKYPAKDLAKKVAILPQGPVAPEGITVEELCFFGRHPHRKWLNSYSEYDKEIVKWALQVTGMYEYSKRTIEALSGGQRQRVWIAMALTQETDILFLDEPTTYLDLAYQIEILELLKNLNKTTGKTIVMVLHELNQASRYADHLISMKNGKIYSQGNVEKVFNSKMLEDVFGLNAKIIEDPIAYKPMCVPIGVK